MRTLLLPGATVILSRAFLVLWLSITVFNMWAGVTKAGIPSEDAADARLEETVLALDAEVFEAFNHCSEPGQLQKHASYFDPEVEFYHDMGGVTWSRQEMLVNTEKYVCGHFRRELIPGTFEVFAIKDFGAIAQGEHRFCQFSTGQCEGIARFVIVWRYADRKWQITRVLSYGHRPLA